MASASNRRRNHEKDRRFAGQTPLADMTAQDRWCADLLRRHTPGSKSVEIKWVLDFASCPVPGSYSANQRGVVRRCRPGEIKQFSVHNIKRYDQALLDATMNEEGWRSRLEHWRYAEEYHPRLLLLYQRVRSVTDEN
jgi:hypothetical protein